MKFELIDIDKDVTALAEIFVEAFNAAPWYDEWTIETASKRLQQLSNVQDFFGIKAFYNGELCGMILGSEEQFYDGRHFQIKEFCTKQSLRGNGFGSIILEEFEKRLIEKGISSIHLLTEHGEATEGFYQKRDYKTSNVMIFMSKNIF